MSHFWEQFIDDSESDTEPQQQQQQQQPSTTTSSSFSSSSEEATSSSSEDDEESPPTDDEIRELFEVDESIEAEEEEAEEEEELRNLYSSSDDEETEEDEDAYGVVEASREDREANERLENILERLDNVKIPPRVIWYEPAAIQHHRVVWAALRDGVQVLQGRIRHVNVGLVRQLFDYTYTTIMSNLPAITQAPLGATDEYEHTPLLTMYRACMVFFEYLYRVGDMGRVRFFDVNTECPEDSRYIRGPSRNIA